MTLSTEIVDFIRLDLFKEPVEIAGIGQIAVMQKKSDIRIVRILIKMIYAQSVECTCATDNSVNFVTFFQKQFSKIGTVLTGDSGYQCSFHNIAFRL